MNGEKPYDFVPLSDRVKTAELVGHDAYTPHRYTGTLHLILNTLTPLQVASGHIDFFKEGGREYLTALQASVPVRDGQNLRRQYIIPGSSLKGAVRSLVEAISPSCVWIAHRRTRRHIPNPYGPCRPPRLCPACRLFGAQDYHALVSFEDALIPSGSLVLHDSPPLWTPARGGQQLPPIYLRERNQVKGRKFYRHYAPAKGPDWRAVVKTNTSIHANIHFENLTEGELGLLVSAIGLNPDHHFPIKLGAGKPVGMGSVQVDLKSVFLLQGVEGVRSTGRLGGAHAQQMMSNELRDSIEKWCQQAIDEKLIDSEALKKLAQIYDEGGLRETAPEKAY